MSEADSQRNKHASLLWGVLGVLVCSMLLYEAFLYNRLLSAQWTNAQYSAHVALSNVRLKLALGLRLGIPLDRYARAPLLVHEVSDVTGLPLALCNNMGDVLSIAGAFSAALLPQELAETRDMQVIEGEDGRLALLPLLAGPDDKVVGCVAAFLHRKTLERETRLLCLRNAALHMLVVLLGHRKHIGAVGHEHISSLFVEGHVLRFALLECVQFGSIVGLYPRSEEHTSELQSR